MRDKGADDMRFKMSEKKAHEIAVILQGICWLMTLFAMTVAVLVLLGRVEVSLTTPAGHYEGVLLLEKDHNVTSRFLFTQISDQKVFLQTEGTVGFVTWLAISLIGIVRVFPMGFCFFLLTGFFKNISEGKVFVAPNANILLNSAGALIIASLITPILNAFVFPLLINHFTANRLTISVSPNFTGLFFGAVLLVMAYVFHYGIYLQDEADHTL